MSDIHSASDEAHGLVLFYYELEAQDKTSRKQMMMQGWEFSVSVKILNFGKMSVSDFFGGMTV